MRARATFSGVSGICSGRGRGGFPRLRWYLSMWFESSSGASCFTRGSGTDFRQEAILAVPLCTARSGSGLILPR